MIKNSNGILFTCNFDGNIVKVIRNELDIDSENLSGKLFTSLFAPDSISNAIQFIHDIKKHSAVFGTSLTLKINDFKETMNFGGGIFNNEIIILGSNEIKSFEIFLTEMMQINNEQTNLLRSTIKEKHKSSNQDNLNSEFYLEELSRLNNELTSTQRELSKKNAELIKLNDMKNELLGIAAHDLRNPLGFIANYIELIEEERDKLSNDQKEFIEQIKFLDKFMLNLVSDLLDVSSIEAGKLNLDISDVDLVSEIEKIVSFNKLAAKKKNIKINLETDIKVLKIKVDLIKIQQVITNLITNAIKFSERGSSIDVKLTTTDNRVKVSVKDYGAGIKEDELDNLFEPFQRASTKSTDGERSTGLGLYIARKIIEGHNGKINVESSPGEGSIFYFTLPLKN